MSHGRLVSMWRRPFVRLVLAFLAFGSAGWLLISTSGFLSDNAALYYVLLGLAILTLLTTLPAHLFVAHRAPTRLGLNRTSNGNEVQLKSIRREHQDFLKKFPPDQIASFTDSFLNLKNLRGRVNHEIHVRRRVLRERVSTILEIPHALRDRVVLFPVLTPTKGELQDDLSLLVDGEPIATLTHYEYMALITVIMDTLLLPAPGTLTTAEMLRLRKDGKKAIKWIATRRHLDERELRKVTRCASRIQGLAGKAGSSLIVAAVLLKRLANNYVIVGVLPKCDRESGRRVVSYERYQIPTLRSSLKTVIGLLLGARPKYIRLDLGIAATAHSYHLLVMGPEGTYLGWQNLSDESGLLNSSSVTEKLNHPYKRFRRRLGQRYLHLYLRSVPPQIANKLRLDIKFFEVPPGSMAGAALAAAANFALVLLIAMILPSARHSGAENPLGSDFPAIVLAFPAVAGAFVGYDNKSTALVGGTLSSKFSSLVTIVLSLAASGLFMAQQTQKLMDPIARGVLGIRDGGWQLLVIAALANTLYAAYTWMARTLGYYWLAHRPDDVRPGPIEQ